MKHNFLKITFRNLLKNKVYAGISLLGLALGVSSCVLIALYVTDELSYDKHHLKSDRIYRLTSDLHFNGEMFAALTNLPSGPSMKDEYPEVESYVRFRSAGAKAELSIDGQVFNESNVWFSDSTLFDVFTYNLVEGNKEDALNQPNTIVLTKALKQKMIGEGDALGQNVKINNTVLTISGVIQDPPANSDIQINALISMNTLPQQFFQTFNQDWFRIGFYTFLLFNQPIDQTEFEAKLSEFEEKYVQPWSAENQIEAGLVYHITPLEEVHFQQGLDYDFPKGNMGYIWIFSLLAIFILIIASINYINLSLAQSAKRAKEVGVRKTLGALRKELVVQFIGESVIIAFIATIIGLALVELTMGTFNNATGKSFGVLAVMQPEMLFTIFIIILAIGAFAGAYPAIVLSRYQPVKVLKGIIPNKGGVGSIQKTLILIQFIFSLFMITATILINDQMTFLKNKNLGFDQENVLSVTLPSDTNVSKRIKPWVEDLRSQSGIEAVSLTNLPTGNTGELMFRIEKEGKMNEQTVRFLFVDEHFLDVLNIDLVEGRNFDREIATDQQQAFLINAQGAKSFGWEGSAIDKRVQWGLMPNGGAANDGKIVGVIEDFHFLSLHNPMEPIILCYNPSGSNTLSIKLSTGNFEETLAGLENDWNELAPMHPFSYRFMDDALDQNYKQEQAMGTIFKYFAIISILIATLGLFALLSFNIQGRIKEIGVRKVLGASTAQLAWILVKDFLFLLLLAFVITAPINSYFIHKWLASFAYTVPLQPLSFLIALGIGLGLSAITVIYHIYRISIADPIDALRYE